MKAIHILAAAALFFGAANLYADPFSVSLNTGGSTDLLVQTSIANGYQFAYENITLGAAIGLPPVVSASDSTFLATYVVTNGVGALNVTDTCVKVNIGTPLAPCQAFTFSYTNLAIGNASVVSALVGTNVLANANVANFTLAGGSIALGGGQVNFNPAATPSPTPEPSSIALVATGVLGAAGFVRRRFPLRS